MLKLLQLSDRWYLSHSLDLGGGGNLRKTEDIASKDHSLPKIRLMKIKGAASELISRMVCDEKAELGEIELMIVSNKNQKRNWTIFIHLRPLLSS